MKYVIIGGDYIELEELKITSSGVVSGVVKWELDNTFDDWNDFDLGEEIYKE